MLVHPPSAARLAFGAGSYPRHRELYRSAGLKVRTYTSPGTSLDIDTPADLEALDETAGARVEIES
jgi:2-phospho-L-lactate guanylyltransferase (CobY/MobA/RfbA family)